MSKVTSRLQTAFRPSTSQAYNSMFTFSYIPFPHTNTNHILVFLEFLVFNKVSNLSINNYISALKAKFSIYGLDTGPFLSPKLKYFSRSLAFSAPCRISLKSVIDIPPLTQITLRCNSIYMGLVFKAAFLLLYFSFLKISNLVPHLISTFNPLEQLTREDIIFGPPGAHVIIKWSKTLQAKNTVRILKIPSLGASPLCPVSALRTLLTMTPLGEDKPLFQVKYKRQWVPFSDSRLRKNLSTILKALKLENSNITFHSFR